MIPMSTSNIHQNVTDRIVQALKSNVVPWRKTWRTTAPTNIASKRKYKGINTILLSCHGYSSNVWGTYKQIAEAGGQVRKGEKGSMIVFWSSFEKEVDGKIKKLFVQRVHSVFNVEQCDGFETEEKAPETGAGFERAQKIVEGYKGPSMGADANKVCYVPSEDKIYMPPRSSFESSEAYYSTLFHEMSHSTGHASRLARPGIVDPIRFASHNYSFEELVAEFSSAFLMAEAGIDNPKNLENHTAYIQSWLRGLQENPKWALDAASQASKSAAFVLGTPAQTDA